MFQRLLICTDLTDGLQRFVNFVPALAAGGAKSITFLHALPFSQGQVIPRVDEAKMETACDRLSIAQAYASESVQINLEVQGGNPVDCIRNVVREHKPDAIFLGTSSRSGLGSRLFGSTFTELSKQNTAPLLIFRPQLLLAYRIEELDLRCRHLFESLLVPYDGSPPAERTIEAIKRSAQQNPGNLKQCLLNWVVEKGKYANLLGSNSDEIARKLESARATLEALDIQIATATCQGEPVPEILKAASDNDISAIACSSGSLGKLIEWSVPSVASEILSRSWHPVLYFPPGKA